MKLFTLSLFVLAASPMVAQQDSGSSLADHLPANTLFYFEIPDIPGLRDGLAGSSMGRIYQDPDVQEFAGAMIEMGMGQWQVALSQIAEQGVPVQFFSWDAFSDLAFGISAGEGAQPGEPGMLIGASIGLGNGLGATAFEMIASAAPTDAGFTVTRDGDHGMVVGQPDPGTVVRLERTGDRLVLFVRHNLDGQFQTLAEDRDFRQARQQVMSQGMATFGYYNPQATLAMQRSFMRLGEMDEGLSTLTETVMSFSEEAVGNARAISFASGWNKGESVNKTYVGFGGESPGWAYQIPPADLSLVDYIPSDATSFAISGMGGGESSERGMEMLDGILADELMQQNLAVWQQYEPISHSWLVGENRPLLDKAVRSFGTRSFSYSTPTGARMFVELKDPAGLQEAITPLMKAVAQALDKWELPVSLRAKRESPREHPEITVPVYYLRLKADALPSEVQQFAAFLGSIEPSFAVHPDGWLVGSMSRSQVRSVVRGGLSKAEHSIRENKEAADFLSRVPNGTSQLAWSDPRPGVAQMVGYAQLGLGFASGMVDDPSMLPFDPSSFPGPASFTKHMRTSESLMWMSENGMHSWSRGSFGLADLMALAGYCLPAGAMFLTAMEGQRVEGPSFDMEEMAPVPSDPYSRTYSELGRLQTGVLLYELANDSLPTELDAILGKTPDGSFYIDSPGRGIGSDGWGHPFVYKVEGDNFVLYSVGENGVDEAGKGDDLSLD